MNLSMRCLKWGFCIADPDSYSPTCQYIYISKVLNASVANTINVVVNMKEVFKYENLVLLSPEKLWFKSGKQLKTLWTARPWYVHGNDF